MSKPHDQKVPPHTDHSAFGPLWWQNHYQQNPTRHADPSPHLLAEVAGLPCGSALDAGCGDGADALWLARQGWLVTAVDVSPTAISNAQEYVAQHASDVSSRICWVLADLTTWLPPKQYDLVISQYVHPAVEFREFVVRLAENVMARGTLLIVGHDHGDEHSAAHAPSKASIGIDSVTASLSAELWDVEVAESRLRRVGHLSTRNLIHDVVVKAHRRPA